MKKMIVLVILVVSVFTIQAQPASGGYQIGDVVADFSLMNVDGRNVSLSDYPDAKGFIVIFTCNTCPVSVVYEDRINALDAKYGPQGFPVIAINPNDPVVAPDESYEKMQERSAAKGFTFPYLMDPDHLVTRQFSANRTPHAFILSKGVNGMHQLAYIGAIDDDSRGNSPNKKFVEDAISALQSGKKPDPDFTKAVGCTIKWQSK